MANSTTLTFAGDADSLRRATQQATEGLDDVGAAANEASSDMADTSSEGTDLTTKMGHLGSAVSGATDALDAIGGSLNALSDIQNMAANRAQRQARLTADVEQAQIDQRQAAEDLRQANLDLTQSYLDGEQALVDGKQAAIDIKQATLDAEVAQGEYNAAVKEHGLNSAEARQASIDLDQATADLAQAQLDQKQAQQDATQYTADGRQAMLDATQATRDGKDATLDLKDALAEQKPGALKEWAGYLEMVTPLITAAVGVIGLVTAAQWLWNASLWASPVTWIVVAVIAVVAGIVILAMHTDELKEIWNTAWGGIKAAAGAVWDWISGTLWPGIKFVYDAIADGIGWVGERWTDGWSSVRGAASRTLDWLGAIPGRIGSMFSTIGGYVVAPFKWAFNTVADAWNRTVGSLHWTVPSWVPFIGGNSVSAPRLPKYHWGGIVPGSMGSEVPAILRAGERVTGGSNSDAAPAPLLLGSDGSRLGDLLIELIADAIARRGGDVDRVLGVTRG